MEIQSTYGLLFTGYTLRVTLESRLGTGQNGSKGLHPPTVREEVPNVKPHDLRFTGYSLRVTHCGLRLRADSVQVRMAPRASTLLL